MAPGTFISDPNGDLNIIIPNNPDAGIMTLSNLLSQTIMAWNQSLAANTDVIINNGSIQRQIHQLYVLTVEILLIMPEQVHLSHQAVADG